MPDKRYNLAVIMGGPSAEHEVSLETGRVILNALDKSKYNLEPVVVTKEGGWILKSSDENVVLGVGEAFSRLKSKNTEVALIAMHGTFGEDGTIQGLLEAAGVAYTGSGILASALAMDKVKTMELLSSRGVLVPKWVSFSKTEWKSSGAGLKGKIESEISFPCVVKPSNCGSSIGITKVEKSEDLEKAIELAFNHDKTVIAQEYISGNEVTCAVLDEGAGTEPTALPPTQIFPKSTFFDYRAKYEQGGSEEVTPPRMPAEMIKNIQAIASRVHVIIGCAGMSRTDMIVSGGLIYVLELNTIPGMTETSLFPQAAAAAGIAFPDLLDRIIQAALRKGK